MLQYICTLNLKALHTFFSCIFIIKSFASRFYKNRLFEYPIYKCLIK